MRPEFGGPSGGLSSSAAGFVTEGTRERRGSIAKRPAGLGKKFFSAQLKDHVSKKFDYTGTPEPIKGFSKYKKELKHADKENIIYSIVIYDNWLCQ
ncbi:MAG: hypothetical protein LBH94_05535 [Deltaproteobacteria bacterium]|jgi:hypothetical protein|nr:hypothetical protein [Deltaproteobacteria bacterium]